MNSSIVSHQLGDLGKLFNLSVHQFIYLENGVKNVPLS